MSMITITPQSHLLKLLLQKEKKKNQVILNVFISKF